MLETHCGALYNMYAYLLNFFWDFSKVEKDHRQYQDISNLETFMLKYVGASACIDVLQKFHQNLNLYGVLCPKMVNDDESNPKAQKIEFKKYADKFKKIKTVQPKKNATLSTKASTTTTEIPSLKDAILISLRILTEDTEYDPLKIYDIINPGQWID
jgi:hypothetical protein